MCYTYVNSGGVDVYVVKLAFACTLSTKRRAKLLRICQCVIATVRAGTRRHCSFQAVAAAAAGQMPAYVAEKREIKSFCPTRPPAAAAMVYRWRKPFVIRRPALTQIGRDCFTAVLPSTVRSRLLSPPASVRIKRTSSKRLADSVSLAHCYCALIQLRYTARLVSAFGNADSSAVIRDRNLRSLLLSAIDLKTLTQCTEWSDFTFRYFVK